MRLIETEKISNYIKNEINPYGNPFEGNAYEFGLKLMKYLENASVDYDVDNVVEQLETARDGYSTAMCMTATNAELVKRFIAKEKAMNLAIEIVKAGGMNNNSKTSD